MDYNVASYMKKMVVILIRNAAPSDFGGGERVPVFIAHETQKVPNLKPIVFSHSEKLLSFAQASGVTWKKTWWWSRQNWSGIKALLFPVYLVWQIILFLYYLVLFIYYRVSVVHIQSKDDFIAATFAGRLVGARVIWSDHADLKHIFMNHRVWYKNPVGKLVYFAAHYCKWIAVVSNEDLRLISKHIPNSSVKNKLRVIYNGAFDSYNPVEKYKTFTFISTGRLVTDKGIGELIEAFKEFNETHNDSQLYLLGDGPDREKFKEKAAGNDNIHMLGYQQDPLGYVAKSHVFALPTYHEGFSLALVEACMLQMPIIATDVGGNPEIIRDEETGLLVKAKDVDTLLKAMLELYNNKDLRTRIAKNARKEYEREFDFERIISDKFISFYEESL